MLCSGPAFNHQRHTYRNLSASFSRLFLLIVRCLGSHTQWVGVSTSIALFLYQCHRRGAKAFTESHGAHISDCFGHRTVFNQIRLFNQTVFNQNVLIACSFSRSHHRSNFASKHLLDQSLSHLTTALTFIPFSPGHQASKIKPKPALILFPFLGVKMQISEI